MKKQDFLKLFWFLIFIVTPYKSIAQGNLESMRQMIFEKTNELRVLAGHSILKPLDSLMELAQYHSENMVKHHFYSHTDHEGLNPIERAEKKGLNPWVKKDGRFYGIAENIAKTPWFENVRGCGDTQSESSLTDCMVTGWKNSEPHYKNIIGDYTYLGVGLFFDSSGIVYGTQNFR